MLLNMTVFYLAIKEFTIKKVILQLNTEHVTKCCDVKHKALGIQPTSIHQSILNNAPIRPK